MSVYDFSTISFYAQQSDYVQKLNDLIAGATAVGAQLDINTNEIIAARDGAVTLLAHLDSIQSSVGALQIWAEGASDFDQDNKVAIDGMDINALQETLYTSSNIVDIFIYDTRLDSDGGRWRDRCTNTGWYNETLNTATRGSKREFPSVVAIVVEASQVIIYDLTEEGLPMWMVFTAGGSADASYEMVGPVGLSSASAINGCIYIGIHAAATHPGIAEIRFIEDIGNLRRAESSGVYQKYAGGIDTRNDTRGAVNIVTAGNYCIKSGWVNGIATALVDGAPLDPATGLPVPMVAVSTTAGISIVRHDGYVVDIIETTGTNDITENVAIKLSGELVFSHQRTTDPAYAGVIVCDIPTADWSATYFASLSGYNVRNYTYQTTLPQLGPTSTSTRVTSIAASMLLFMGITSAESGLRIIRESPNGSGEGSIAYITHAWATPQQIGDVELCLDGSSLTDRSKEASTVTGSATYAVVATGTSLQASTASSDITVTVTTGGECYGWEYVSGSWHFRRDISEWSGVSESGGTLTIANGTIFTRLVFTADTPLDDQLDAIIAEDQPLFAAGASHLLMGTSSAIIDVTHDVIQGITHVLTSYGRTSFQGLTRIDSEATAVGTPVAVVAMDGARIQAGSTSADYYTPSNSLRDELQRGPKHTRVFDSPIKQFDQSSGASDTTFWLGAGWKPISVYWAASGNMSLVPLDDYTFITNGAEYGIEFDSAPGSGTVGILASRSV